MNKHSFIVLIVTLFPFLANGQEDPQVWTNITVGERIITPAYRITENPVIVDTVIASPTIQYPLLSRHMKTDISITPIEPSKVKIVEKLDKLYPGYVRLGIGNYASPMGEIYYNSMRNRKVNYGVAIKHNSSFGNIKDYAPSSFDYTTGRLFGDFFTTKFRLQPEFNYLNHGYHYYGIRDTAHLISKDSLTNRVQGIGGSFRFSNYTSRDSAILLYSVYTNYMYFHEFINDTDTLGLNGKNNRFNLGTEMKYKFKKNIFAANFDINYNQYNYNLADTAFSTGYSAHEQKNWLIHLRPTISTYGGKWKIIYGVDLNIDTPSDTVFKVVPVFEAKYSLFNDMFIPYIGVDGGVKQNSFQSLNRENEFMLSGVNLRNTKTMNFYGGIKGTLSKTISFNARVSYKLIDNLPLFVNDTVFSDMYRFRVIYNSMNVFTLDGSFSYQNGEKLKIDLMGEYNNYSSTLVGDLYQYAWHLPTYAFTLRGNYNLFEKIYVKADFVLKGGRTSPFGLFDSDATTANADLGVMADANLHAEYRYSKRLSAFIQFNNLAAQRYQKWYGYPVQGFQIMGGLTFGF
ncbi:MAG: hypothetical protein HYZ14_08100 [Bacteroidetes bacterium]|nr:hypothetical protein [Bacteroidota bacterium]